MGQTFFIADNHFYHDKVIGYENRPFKNSDEMTEVMVNRWNSAVNKQDKIFVLGDFMFHPKDHLQKIVSRLQGNKILILGNHDKIAPSNYLEAGFSEVYRYPIIYEDFWILSHYPMYINSNMPYANIFGHVHSNPEYVDYTSQSICVSVERAHMNYAPISFDKVKELLNIKNDSGD